MLPFGRVRPEPGLDVHQAVVARHAHQPAHLAVRGAVLEDQAVSLRLHVVRPADADLARAFPRVPGPEAAGVPDQAVPFHEGAGARWRGKPGWDITGWA
jgi:hypothetical protein